jgi:hypothetical protein
VDTIIENQQSVLSAKQQLQRREIGMFQPTRAVRVFHKTNSNLQAVLVCTKPESLRSMPRWH